MDDVFDAFGGPDGGPPLYVSSITYGRRVIFTAESNVSMSELSHTEFAYSGGVVDVDGSVSSTNREVLQTASMTAFILGAVVNKPSKLSTVSMIHESLFRVEASSADSRRTHRVQPAHLADNSLADVGYNRLRCQRMRTGEPTVLVTLDSITTTDGGNQVRIYGDVTARANDRNGQQNEVNLFDVDRSDAFELDEGDTCRLRGPQRRGLERQSQKWRGDH